MANHHNRTRRNLALAIGAGVAVIGANALLWGKFNTSVLIGSLVGFTAACALISAVTYAALRDLRRGQQQQRETIERQKDRIEKLESTLRRAEHLARHLPQGSNVDLFLAALGLGRLISIDEITARYQELVRQQLPPSNEASFK